MLKSSDGKGERHGLNRERTRKKGFLTRRREGTAGRQRPWLTAKNTERAEITANGKGEAGTANERE